MKSILKSVLFSSICTFGSLFTLQIAHAAGSAGCGLGSVVFKGNEWWKQLFAATTNGSTLSQSFGITSGTSNCAPGIIGQIQKQKDFVAANLSSLQREAAQGNGDSMNGLASVLGCSASDYGSFGMYTQSHYAQVFNANTSDTILDNIKMEVQRNKLLSQACPLASI